ncbi:type I secretion system permease/ATPase [Mesorhizobium sp. B2-4-13]|uniref:type I secretion system permease/ATPase n=1 Tax=Mesorhizobium sp. B2-4-13 TaxID=2589936 RepID=UPI00114F45C0|nr:type I secretion system permease/ATPase [Mesorhizobium sp. B2-4-13]TPK85673.1 type I secretion system permease/ATPase [Mesorhizobium sp. B2-4-13]
MSTQKKRTRSAPDVSQYIGNYRGLIVFLLCLSGVINLLALTGSFYMLQIYDRALPSGSVPTLVAFSVLAIGLYLFQGLFDVLRSQILVRYGARLDARLAPLAHQVVIEMPRYGYSTSEALERGRDVDTVRGFISSQAPIALFDLPWMPLFLGFVYLLHPMLGLLTVAGAIVLIALTVITEVMTRNVAKDTHRAAIMRSNIADAHARNADILKAMGFGSRAVSRFSAANDKHLYLQTKTSDVTGSFSGLAKVLRMMLQSALLGLGAYLTMKGELSSGSIIACSVASARALAPIDMAIGNWKGFVAARRSFGRLKETLAAMNDESQMIDLPAPCQTLKVEKATVVAPHTGAVLLGDVSFELKAGDALGLIGPSGGGKTSLVKGIVGVWPLLRGSIRLDDAELDQWHSDKLGAAIGYLPQDVSLLEGTIAENISRFDPQADARGIVAAARAAGVHQMIVRLSQGYQTELGPNGTALSAGQRQRIGLARALYGDPFLVVLDEPNSNLDAEGEAALTDALKGVRQRGGIAIVIAHRPSALAAVDLVGLIQNGKLVTIGPKTELIREPMRVAPMPASDGEVGAAPMSRPGGKMRNVSAVAAAQKD